ncbi:PAS domain S-box protein [Aureimonas psammosilenae]|uniref:PAS domain S-box protein n=1 Tax=Aureimonas psammosilenae TaxID=2495496 RepID=UPI001F2493EB|nr:PAS domain S-box protein [Aureimonas psammosilenae]
MPNSFMTDPLSFLDGGGEAAQMIRNRDWSNHPLGKPEDWSPAFKSALSLILNSPESMILAWGPDLSFFFNDTYFPLLGPRLPWAMGERFDVVWADGWEQAKPIIDEAFAGRSRRFVNLPWKLDTDRGAEDTWWSFSYSRVLGEHGEIAGLFIFTNETTERVLAERRRLKDEEQLRRSEAFFSATLDALPVGAIIADAKGRILRDNVANREIWGVPPETDDWSGYANWVGYYPDTGQRLKAEDWAMSRAILHGETVRDELVEIERFDGAGRRMFLNNGAPIRDGENNIIGGVVVELDITERMEVDRRLRESEALARENVERVQLALSAGAIIGTWVWDLPTDRFTVDEAFARNFGLDPALGRVGLSLAQVVETVHPDDSAGLAEAIRLSIERGGAYAHQYRVRREDGRYYWIEANGRVDRAPDGTPLRFPGVLIDVDERRAIAEERDRTAAMLREQAAEFQALADNIPILCWMADADGRIYWFNRRWYDYTGGTPETMEGDGWLSVPEPAILPTVTERWRHSLATGEPFDMTFQMKASDGGYRPFLTRVVPIRNADGEVVRWFGTNTDVTEQLAAARALAAMNETLEDQVAARTAERDQIWQASTDLLCVADLSGRLLSINPAWTATLGWDEAELKATTCLDLVHPEDAERTLAAFADLARGHAQLAFENRYRSKDGSYRWFSWNSVPRNGVIYSSIRDITEMRSQANALVRAEEALRQSQKMEAVGQLTGGIAHDFNNLLAGISGSLELLSTRISQGRTEDIARYINGATGAAKRAAALTHRLLAFSRRQTLDPKPTDVNRLVFGMEDLVRRTVGPSISVEVAASDDLWMTLVDPNQLENALLNLCINARDALPDGGRITIETTNRRLDEHAALERDLPPGQYVSLSVSDNGTGMTPEVVEKAFEPFFTTKPLGVGTGLGLSMIYGFARQSGGQARIHSTVDVGSTISLLLPRHVGAADELEAVPDLADAPRAEAGETVLVVDDEPLVRMLILDVLEDLGYKALEAEDGRTGLAILQSDVRIDLLVSDVGLPGGMNGRQMADAARVSRPDLKVLFVTGYAENAVVGNGNLDAGMHVVTKPFAMEQLANRIKSLIAEG